MAKARIRLLCILGTALFTTLFFLSSYVWLSFSYLGADAKYARDNLEYLTERLEEIGLSEKIHVRGLSAVQYPLPKAAFLIAEYADSWTKEYLSLTEKTVYTEIDPYDTLSRLVLTANHDDVKAIYDDVVYDAAVCAQGRETEGFTEAWLNGKGAYSAAAYQAYGRLVLTDVLLAGNVSVWLAASVLAWRRFCKRKERERVSSANIL